MPDVLNVTCEKTGQSKRASLCGMIGVIEQSIELIINGNIMAYQFDVENIFIAVKD